MRCLRGGAAQGAGETRDQCASRRLAETGTAARSSWAIDDTVHNLVPNYFPNEYDLYDWGWEKVWVG